MIYFVPSQDEYELTLDSDTAHRSLILSEDNKEVTFQTKKQPYPFHPERFDHSHQVLCRNGVTGRCYWEVEFTGFPNFGVTYRGISRRGTGESGLGQNNVSWVLCYSIDGTLEHNSESETCISLKNSTKVAIYLDWHAGYLSFYKFSSEGRKHIGSMYSRFKEPLYPAFGFNRVSINGVGVQSKCQLAWG